VYKEVYQIGELNARPIFENWTYSQDAGGGNMKTLSSSFFAWAKVFGGSGGLQLVESKIDWKYDIQVVVRYDASITSQTTFVFENQRYIIKSLGPDDIIKKRFLIILAEVSDLQLVQGGIITPNGPAYLFNYIGVGGEYFFQDNSLINKTVFGVFKDGAAKALLFSGSPEPDEVLYEPSLGKFTFGSPFYLDEKAIIQYV
jgi:hypothetical protein